MSHKYLIIILFCSFFSQTAQLQAADSTLQKRQAYLSLLLRMIPEDPTNNGVATPLDKNWRAWLKRTGELPPDFDSLPSLPFLPEPLVLDEGGQNIPITIPSQWQDKKAWIRKQIKHWISGTFPPAPEQYKINVLNEKLDGSVTIRTIELRFGPDQRAKLTLELMIPPGEGPFPVFMTQWNHRGWAMIAVRRGYIGCIYAGADAKDDTQAYGDIWYPEYDFTMLMRRAWGSFRALDYLHTLDIVDTNKIALTGHSRNGKQSLMAAAFDERIKAVISSSGGTGAEIPYRFICDKYDSESILRMSDGFPQWLHPRMRFFIGREHKLPIDQNLMMALVAPRGLMLSSAISEGAGNPLGIEQGYNSAKEVYRFLNAENKISVRLRHGRHGTAARDIETYIDFFDYVFGRSEREPENYLFYNYSFKNWKDLSRETLNPLDFKIRLSDEFLRSENGQKISSIEKWANQKNQILQRIPWLFGEESPGLKNAGPEMLTNARKIDDYLRDVILRPGKSEKVGHIVVGPYHSFGDYLYGNLYFPINKNGNPLKKKVPVVIFLHEYDYTTGFGRRILPFFEKMIEKGYAVFSYDMLGFGTRIQEGTEFYQRYPKWSKMGKMVTDLMGAVDAMENMDIIDPEQIITVGYTLGGTVGLFGAALDERISALATICGFTPLRTATPQLGVEGIKAYSHIHGLLPRLGFFIDHANRLPLDFPEIIATIAPRPHLIIAPQLNRDAVFDDIRQSISPIKQIYSLYHTKSSLTFETPLDYNHFTEDMQESIIQWLLRIKN